MENSELITLSRKSFFDSLTEQQQGQLKSLFHEIGRWEFHDYEAMKQEVINKKRR